MGTKIHTIVHILNKGLLESNNEKTPYELWKGRLASAKNFIIFGCKCYIKRDDQKLGKFDSQTDEGILVGYSCKIKAYKCYNFRLDKVIESINVKYDETNLLKTKEIKHPHIFEE